MILTFSSRFALAYVDELMSSLPGGPNGSLQLAFKRLLSIAGREVEAISRHIVLILLRSLGCWPSNGHCVNVPENIALKMIKWIAKCGLEENHTGNIPVIEQGAHSLLCTLAELMSHHFSTCHSIAQEKPSDDEWDDSSDYPISTCSNDCFKLLRIGDTSLQVAFASMLDVTGDLAPNVDQLIEDGLSLMINEFQTTGKSFHLKTEFYQSIIQSYLNSNMPSVCSLGLCKLISGVVQDPRREIEKTQAPLQPMIFNILAKNKDVKAKLSLDKLMQQAADVVRKGLSDLDEVDNIISECRLRTLRDALFYTCDAKISNPAEYLNFLEKNVPRVCVNVESIAYALTSIVSLRMPGNRLILLSKLGRFPWCPSALALALSAYTEMNDENWLEVFEKLDSHEFQFPTNASILFFINFFKSAFSNGFSLDLMAKPWEYPNGQIEFIEQIIRNPNENFFVLLNHKIVDVSPLENQYCETDPLYISTRCLDIYLILIEIQKEHEEETDCITEIFGFLIEKYPDIVTLALLDEQIVYSEFTFQIVIRAFEKMLPSHKNLKSILDYTRTHTRISPDFFKNMLVFLCKHLHDNDVTSFTPDRLKYMLQSLQAFQKSYPDFINILTVQKDLRNIFGLMTICHEGGLYDFSLFLNERLAQDERQILSFLVSDARAKQYIGLPNPFYEQIAQFLAENKRSLIKYSLKMPPPLKGIPKADKHLMPTFDPPSKKGNTRSTSPKENVLDMESKECERQDAKQILNTASTSYQSDFSVTSKGAAEESGGINLEFPPGLQVTCKQQVIQHKTNPLAVGPTMQRQFGNNPQPSFNPLNSYMQQAPNQNPSNISTMFNGNSLGGSQELFRPPGSHSFGSNSPTNQARPGMPPGPQRQNSNSSWNIPGQQRSTGPPTPLQLDFRAQGPPTQQDFQPRSHNSQAHIFEGDLSQMQFSDDVQDEANSFFEAIYTHRAHVMTVQTLIEKLKGFKNSTEQRDHKLLACVVKNLFEEYKFFNDYPDRELKITAELYGGIIREGIINESANLHFATAVRKVIESLSQQSNSNLFTFGLVALEHCRTKLCTYPKVCSMIAGLENFNKFPQTIREYVMAGMTGDLSRVTADHGRSTPPVWQAPRVTEGRNNSAGGSALPQSRTVLILLAIVRI